MNKRQLAVDFLRLYAGRDPMSAMDASARMQKEWGIRIDWHEFTWAIEDLKSMGMMKPVGTKNFYQKYRYLGA